MGDVWDAISVLLEKMESRSFPELWYFNSIGRHHFSCGTSSTSAGGMMRVFNESVQG